MNKNTKNILTILFVIFVLAAGGLLYYAFFYEKSVEQEPAPVVTTEPVDPETQADELVIKAGRNWVDSEVVDDKFTRTFYLGNVEYLADDGSYQPINTDLVASSNENYAFENTANIFKTYFKEDTSNDDLVTLQLGGKTVAFSFIEPNQSTPTIEANTITYTDILDGLDAKYTVTGSQFLEELVAEKAIEIDKISQKVKVDGVYYKEQVDGSITFHNSATKNLLWILPAPVMYEQDDMSQRNNGLHYEITEEDGYILISKVIDNEGKEWMISANYPIVVDYTLTIYNPDTSWDLEGYVRRRGYPPTAFYTAFPSEDVGPTGGYSDATYSYFYRTFFDFDLTTLGSATIESAYFEHYSRRTSSFVADINVYAGADAWSALSPVRSVFESDLVMGDGDPGTDDYMDTFSNSVLPLNCAVPGDCRHQITIPPAWFPTIFTGNDAQFLFVCASVCEGTFGFTNFRGTRSYMSSYGLSREPRLVLELTVAPPGLAMDPVVAQGTLEPRLSDYSDNETRWVMQRSLNGVSFVTICDNMVSGSSGTCSPVATASYDCRATSTPGFTGEECSFTDTNLDPNDQYYYRAYAERDSPYARSSYSDIVSAYTLAASVSSGPDLDSPDWQSIRVNSAPTDDGGTNPADTLFCMMFDIDPTSINIDIDCPARRYLSYWGIGVDYTFDIDEDAYPGCTYWGDTTVQCHTKTDWSAVSLPALADGGLRTENVFLSPNRVYTGGMYTVNADGVLTDPDNTTPRYTRARDPSPPGVSLSPPRTLTITMDNTPTSAGTYTNPDDTDYSMRAIYNSLTRYVNPDTLTLTDASESWWPHDVAGGSPNWGGNSGKDYDALLNVCYDFQARSKNKDDVTGEDELQDSWSTVTSYCTEAAVPGQPTVSCDYTLDELKLSEYNEDIAADSYYCKVDINTGGNPSGTEYYIEWQACDIDGKNCSGWQLASGWSLSLKFAHHPLQCQGDRTQYQYKVRARNQQNVETGWSAPPGSDTLPPCEPQYMGHSDNPIITGPPDEYPIYWSWTAPDGGQTVKYYNFYDNYGNCLAGKDKDGFCDLTGPESGPIESSTAYDQYYDAIPKPLQPNTLHGAYTRAVDTKGRAGRPSSNYSAYTAIQSPTGINFGNFETDRLEVVASGGFDSPTPPRPPNTSGIQFDEISGISGGGGQKGFFNSDPNFWLDPDFPKVADTGLEVNTQYCYKARSCNGDCLGDGTHDISNWIPSSASCLHTRANVPTLPILEYLTGGTSAKLAIRGNDGNPHGAPGDDTRYVICITQYNNDGSTTERYANVDGDSDGQVDVDWAGDVCADADATGHWAVRGTVLGNGWGGNAGVTITGLDSSIKYDFKVKAMNGNDFATDFGREATLFLVKNNVVGWAWSSNIGWISMNCLNLFKGGGDYSCHRADHWGLNTIFEESREINPLEGYAWAGAGLAREGEREVQNIDLTSTHVKPITYDGTYIWVSTLLSPSKLFQIKAETGTIEQEYPGTNFPNGLRGLTYDDENKYLWGTSEANDEIYKIDPDTGTIINTITLLNCGGGDCDPFGITYDGTDLWVVNSGNNERSVSRISISLNKEINCDGSDPVAGTPTRCSVGSAPQMPYFDGTDVWVNNYYGKSVSKIASDGTVQTINLSAAAPSGFDYRYPVGIAYDGSNLWVGHTITNTETNTARAGISIIDSSNNIIDTFTISSEGSGAASRQIKGLVYDGQSMWASSYQEGIVYQIEVALRQTIYEYSVGGQSTFSLFDSKNIWVTNYTEGSNGKVHKFIGRESLTGLGWISLNSKVCSNDQQLACADDGDCGGGANTCDESAGTPPDSAPMYGYCYLNDGAGERYGVCDDGTTNTCTETGLTSCTGSCEGGTNDGTSCTDDTPCTGGGQCAKDPCILETCQTGDTCPDYDATNEVCKTSTTANFNGITREIEGWARILSRKDYGTGQGFNDWGWIKLQGNYNDGFGDTGPYNLTGVEVDSQEFLGDPDVNPNDVKLYSLFGWAWNSEISDFASSSSWLKPTNISQVGMTYDRSGNSMVIDSKGDPHIAWSGKEDGSFYQDIYYVKLKAGEWVTVTGDPYQPDNAVSANVTVESGYWSIAPSLVLDANDNPHIAWQKGGSTYYLQWDSQDGRWETITGEDAGDSDTWLSDGVNSKLRVDLGGSPDLELDLSGNPYIVYSNSGEIYYRKWDAAWVDVDGGAEDRLNVSNTPAMGSWSPKLALSSNESPQKPHIAWHEQDAGGDYGKIYYRHWDSTDWVTASGDVGDTMVQVNYNVAGIIGAGWPSNNIHAEDPNIALDSNNQPGIVWRDPCEVFYRKWGPELGDWVSASGYTDITNLWVNMNTPTGRTGCAFGGGLPSLIIKNDQPRIAWGEGDPAEIRYRYWNGSNWVTASGDYDGDGDGYLIDDEYFNVSQTPGRSARASLALDKWGNANITWNETKFSSQYCGAFDGDGVIDGPAGEAHDVAIDGDYMYVVGQDTDSWRLEKRRLDDGRLCDVAACGTEFGTGGVAESDPSSYSAWNVVVDSSAGHLYVVGREDTGGGDWRIEKRNVSDGALVATGIITNGWQDGVILVSDGAVGTQGGGVDVAIDSTYMYIAGRTDSADWRLEKRSKGTGVLIGNFGQNGVITINEGQDLRKILIDSTYMYVAGKDDSDLWRIEKRLLSNGSVDTSFGYDCSSGTCFFTGNGVITGPDISDSIYDLALDSNYIYPVGRTESGGRDFLIGKFDRATGQPFTSGSFDSNGLIRGTADTQYAYGISVDSDNMYLLGREYGTPMIWRYEKRSLDTGDLVVGFGTGGVETSVAGWPLEIAIDSVYLYAVGFSDGPNWRIEKRWLSTGALDSSYSADDCIDSKYPQCISNYCAAVDINYSKWFPGKVKSGLGWISFMPAGALLGIPWVQTMFSDIYAGGTIELAPPPRGSGQYTATYLILADGSIQGVPGYYGQTETGPPTSELYVEGFEPLIEEAGQPLGENAISKIDISGLTTLVSNCYDAYESGNSTDCASAIRGDNKFGHVVFKDTSVGTVDISQSPADPFVTRDVTEGQPILNGIIYYFNGAIDYKINNGMKFMKGDDFNDGTAGNGLIIINGDLEINKDISYDQTALDPTNGKISELPSVAFIVQGDVYIDSLVAELAGVWVAVGSGTSDGNIYTSRVKWQPDIAIGASDDDTYISRSGATFTNHNSEGSIKFGKPTDDTVYRAYLRWSINIDPGSEIRKAYIKLKDDGNSEGSNFSTRIYYIEDNDGNVDAFNSVVDAKDIYNLPTSKSVSYDTADWVNAGGTWNETVDISELVQRFIDRSDYQPGNYIGVAIKEGGAQTGEFKSFYSVDGGNPAELVIEYSQRREGYGIEDQYDGAQAYKYSNPESIGSEPCGINCPFGWIGSGSSPRKDFKRTFLRFTGLDIPTDAEILGAHLQSELSRDWSGDYGSAGYQVRQGLLAGYPADYNGRNPFDDPLDQDVSEIAQDLSDGKWTTSSGVCVGGSNEGLACTNSPGQCYGVVNGWCKLESVIFRDIAPLVELFISRDDYDPGVVGSSELSLRLRRGSNSVEGVEGSGEIRSIRAYYSAGSESLSFLEVDYQVPLHVNGLFVAHGFSFDRKYAKELAASEQIVYDGRVVANTPPGLSDFAQALPIYQKVVPQEFVICNS